MLQAKASRRALWALASAISLASFAVAAQDNPGKSEILRIEHALVSARRSDQVLKYFDPGIVMVDMVPRNAQGIENLRANLQAQYSKVKELRGELLDISIDADDRLAFAHSTQRLAWTSVASGEKTEMIVRITDIYHRVKGKWLIVLQHVSVPFDPTSGRAILDGLPAGN